MFAMFRNGSIWRRRLALSCGLMLLTLVTARDVAAQTLEERVEALEKQIAVLQETLDHLTSVLSVNAAGDLEVTDADLIVDGGNLHVLNGTGSTWMTNGLGNVIIGYNLGTGEVRTGSHNLVIGDNHSYSSYVGIVAGANNSISAPYALVLSGLGNTASGLYSVVVNGFSNDATGQWSAVVAGGNNLAAGHRSAILGGNGNVTNGGNSTISGGYANITGASAFGSAVSGGLNNDALHNYSTVSGGSYNVASGPESTVGGGFSNTASGTRTTVSGGANCALGTSSEWGAGDVESSVFGSIPLCD